MECNLENLPPVIFILELHNMQDHKTQSTVDAYVETMFIVHVQPLLHSVKVNIKTAA